MLQDEESVGQSDEKEAGKLLMNATTCAPQVECEMEQIVEIRTEVMSS